MRKALPCLLEDAENGLSVDFRILLEGLQQDLLVIVKRTDELDKHIHTLAHSHEDAKRLLQIPGVGPLIATAIISAVGDGKQLSAVGSWRPGSG